MLMIMEFVEDASQNKVMINLSNMTHFEEKDAQTTTIYFGISRVDVTHPYEQVKEVIHTALTGGHDE